MNHSIAIVGMSCVYPDARTPLELWDNVLAQRRAFRRLPSQRLRSEDYLSDDPHAPDRTYVAEAAVIEGYEFDRVSFRVVGSTYRSADLAHWLALDVASRALDDAGFKNGDGLSRETTGVVLGNTLTGEFSRANVMRLRWPYVRRVLDAALAEQDWSADRRREFLEPLEAQYKAPFPPVGEETLAGGLSNTIAGRICNQFDLKGGGYTVDGACSASLLAVANACSSLVTGDLDTALAGGVDLSLDPFELVGFAKTGALAPEMMRIYDARSAGFWPGEGCGFVVLMRHEDAVAQGRRVYGVVRGWGISSDGAGGITRPEADGQIQALRRAYRRAGYGVDTVEYFEGHGTGTNVGDATELQVISRARRESNAAAPPAVIGSVKANIGHTKAAAGIAGFIKATLALHTQTLPPTTGCEKPHHELTGPSPALRVLSEPEPWPANRPLRASVSAMGFGGINAHIALEGAASERRGRFTPRESAMAHSAQDAELFLLGAADARGLRDQAGQLLSFAAQLSRSELTDLAAELEKRLQPAAVRAALLAASPAELAAALQTLQTWLADGVSVRIDLRAGIFLGGGTTAPRIGFLFPGQGSPAHLDGGIYPRRFEFARELYSRAGLPKEGDGIPTEVAQPAIATASLAGLRALETLGLGAVVAVGHSLGEITALHWAGAMDEAALLRVAKARGRAMAELGSPTGAMAAIVAPWQEVEPLLNGDPVTIVGFNSPRQTVVSGEAHAVRAVTARAHAKGLRTVNLPVSHAFHTPLVAASAPALAGQLGREKFSPLCRDIFSTVTGAALAADADLSALLCRQVTSPVRFTAAVTAAARAADLFIEVGPGHVLAGLVSDTVATPVVALDAGGPSMKGWLRAAGAAFALGAPIKHAALFEGRFTRPFNLNWQPKFFVNPCELAPLPAAEESKKAGPLTAPTLVPPRPSSPAPTATSPLELVRQLVAERAELPAAAVQNDSRLLSDLHLNSITVGQLVAETARMLGLPPLVALNEFANATVGTVAQALEELARTGGARATDEKKRIPAGVDSWVRAFTVDWVEKPLSPLRTEIPKGSWEIFAPPHHPLAARLRAAFADAGGGGVVVCLPADLGDARAMSEEVCVHLLLKAAHAALARKDKPRFILVQHGWGAGGFARSLHLETPEITTCVVDVPLDHPRAAEWVRDEALAAEGYVEMRYDATGVRREPRLNLLPTREQTGGLPLGADDVLLVTGGGKGIAAECALALARKTGARLALLGRSQPVADAELAANLERISAAGIRCRYYAADVTDAAAVKEAVAAAERELGKVTALLHGAGANVPQLVSALDEAAFRRTLAPKIQGARNVLAAVPAEQLRLFLTFGSIIARGGLQGEADYAVANEWLTNLTEQFQTAHPRCRCLALEWSVWSGVGMGQRLGRIESLLQQGITPITPEAGIEMLERLLAQPPPGASVVVTGRFGDLPTLKLERPELPLLRFLEHPRVFYPGVELIVDAELSSESDPYLEDHVYHGERLFPAVMGLEAMAQAAMALAGTTAPPDFEGVQLSRPVVAPRHGKVTIRVAALLRQPGVVEVTLRSEESGFQVDHFRLSARFAGEDGLAAFVHGVVEEATTETEEKTPVPDLKTPPLPLDAANDLYRDLLFHTGRFQRVKNYRLLRARECLVQIEADADSVWFGRYLPQDRVLGDAGVRDAAIHAIQACIPHARLLPIGIGRITIGKVPCLFRSERVQTRTPLLLLHARERFRDGDTFVYDLKLLGEDGTVLEQWEGLSLRKVEELPRRVAWVETLLGPYLERRLEELLPGANLSLVLENDDGTPRPACTDAAIQRALGTAATIRRRADGKPEAMGGDGERSVSAAHAGQLTLAVAGTGPLGCDLEAVTTRTVEAWRDLLGAERWRLAEMIAREAAEDFNAAATRVWAAGECLKKAGALVDAPLVFTTAKRDGWVLMASGALTIATCVASVGDAANRLAVGVLVR